MNTERLKSPALLVGAAIWAGSFALYFSTLAPTLTWGTGKLGVDGGELLAAASTLGVPHPPGYPTYTLLLKAFATAVPIGDFAYRGNLFSAVLTATSVAMLYAVILRFCTFLRPDGPSRDRIASAALGATVLATSPLIWSQATITEVYGLATLFAAALLLIASHLAMRLPQERQIETRQVAAGLAMFGFLLGLGLGSHLTLLAVAVPLVYWMGTAIGWRRLASPWLGGALIAGLAIYVYLPIRSGQNPPVNWGNADTVGGFVWMLSGRVYQEHVFGVPVGSIPGRIVDWVELVFSQFNPLGIFLGLMAAVPLRSRAPRFLAASLASMALLSVYSITYHTFDSEVLTIPAFVVFSIWVGIGFLWAISIAREWARDASSRLGDSGMGVVRSMVSRPALVLGLIAFGALPTASVILNHGSQDLGNDRGAYEYAKGVLAALPDRSVVMSMEEDAAFSLWYMVFVEEVERDIVPVAVPLLQFEWYWRNVQARFPERFPVEPVLNIREALRSIVEQQRRAKRCLLHVCEQVPARQLRTAQDRNTHAFRGEPEDGALSKAIRDTPTRRRSAGQRVP